MVTSLILAGAAFSVSLGGIVIGLLLAVVVYVVAAWLLGLVTAPANPGVARGLSVIPGLLALCVFLACAFDVSGSIST